MFVDTTEGADNVDALLLQCPGVLCSELPHPLTPINLSKVMTRPLRKTINIHLLHHRTHNHISSAGLGAITVGPLIRLKIWDVLSRSGRP